MVTRGTNQVIRSLQLSALCPLQGQEGCWRLSSIPLADDLINHTFVMKPPETPEEQGSESFWAGEHVEMWGGWRA